MEITVKRFRAAVAAIPDNIPMDACVLINKLAVYNENKYLGYIDLAAGSFVPDLFTPDLPEGDQ